MNWKKIRYTCYKVIFTAFMIYSYCPYYFVDKEVIPMLNDFRVEMWNKCSDKYIHPTWQISIKIVDRIRFADKNVIGQCLVKPVGFDIVLKRDFWEASTEVNRKELLSHELFHCYLGVKHEKNTLMNEYHMNYNEEQLKDQLEYFLTKTCRK